MKTSIQAMYDNVKLCVRQNGEYSQYSLSHAGVKQGEPLSSTLFLFFVNDFVESITGNTIDSVILHELIISTLLYADDIILLEPKW